MPIRPPNLDDRRYEDILREAKTLIPQYTPEWTNLSDSDPGMTLVQLFAWMTEMIIYRLNQVPDKTYIHFLNFIGEERKPARPSVAPLTLSLRNLDRIVVEVPPFTRCATRQREDSTAADYLSVDGLTVHGATVNRVMSVRGGNRPAVREIPYSYLRDNLAALLFAGGRGVEFFDLDPIEYGPDAYTPEQYLYISHDDFRLMDISAEDNRPVGRLRIHRGGNDTLSIASFFVWEYPTPEGWLPVSPDMEAEEVLGMPETSLVTALPSIASLSGFAVNSPLPFPEPLAGSPWWIRGRLDYERWVAARMLEDLEINWKDDRGGEPRPLNNWEIHATGRTLEVSLQDVPPIKGGWTIRLALVDRSLPGGKTSYLPRYRWYYRRREGWEEIPRERVRTEGTLIIITGPLTDMVTEGINLRAERIETVYLQGFIPELELNLTWVRPIEVDMYAGDDPRRVERLLMDEGPWSPFQLSPIIPPTIARKWYVGSDLFENRKQAPVVVEIDVGFEMNGTPIPEPETLYMLQLTYRAEDNWRVVWSEDKIFSGFTFANLDPEGAKKAGTRTIRMVLDPKTQLRGLARHQINELSRETTWIRFEMIKSSLTGQDDKKQQFPIVPRIYAIRLGVDGAVGARSYDQPLPSPRIAQLDYREYNRRLTRILSRVNGRTTEFFPYFPFVEIKEENLSVYFQFDRPLPPGRRHVLHMRTRGETYLPEGVRVEWELLEAKEHGQFAWRRLHAPGETDKRPYQLTTTGTLEFPLLEVPRTGPDGFWLRGRFVVPDDLGLDHLPSMPPITHILLNTVDVVNLVTVNTEKFAGLGVPNQMIQLRKAPVFLHTLEGQRSPFPDPDRFPDVRVRVDSGDGRSEWWGRVTDTELLTCRKDDKVFVVDPVEGTITFGNGIHGKMLPVGTANVVVDMYHYIPGARGNLGAGEIVLIEGYADAVRCENLLPASGGRDAETIEEIIRRAPSLLTSRDRAVTATDFAIIAKEASGEVARAACDGKMGPDGTVEVVILPRRREGERVPDAFLSTGLRDHVGSYLKRRCLVNVIPKVRLATFMPVDIAVTLRLRPNANLVAVREFATRWVERFLDPYEGGLDNEGWNFKGTLYAQDFARMVADIAEVRHIVEVQLFDMSSERRRRGSPGWEEGQGVRELVLESHDLFVVRRVRISSDDPSKVA